MEWLTDKLHALIFYPPASTSSDGAELQPLLWIHGGPMCVVSFDYSPFLCWLATLGVCVCVWVGVGVGVRARLHARLETARCFCWMAGLDS